jgi:hypothetical protein
LLPLTSRSSLKALKQAGPLRTPMVGRGTRSFLAGPPTRYGRAAAGRGAGRATPGGAATPSLHGWLICGRSARTARLARAQVRNSRALPVLPSPTPWAPWPRFRGPC